MSLYLTVENNISGINRRIGFETKEELNRFLEGFDSMDENGQIQKRNDERETVIQTERI